MSILKQLSKYIGKYKVYAILTPIIVSLEVVMECLIPFITADLITFVQNGYLISDELMTKWFIHFIYGMFPDNHIAVVAGYCIVLIVMALLKTFVRLYLTKLKSFLLKISTSFQHQASLLV